MDKKYCESACRALRWSRRRLIAISQIPPPDYEEIRQYLRSLPESNGARPCGYSLRRRFRQVGEVSFPEGGRRTKRTPDEQGEFQLADRPFYYSDPFEAPRVPEAGIYLVNLHYPGGRVVPTNRLVEVKAAFPTVRLYDSNFLYDLSGKKFDRPKPKPKKSSDKSGPPKVRKPRRRRTIPARGQVAVAQALGEPAGMVASAPTLVTPTVISTPPNAGMEPVLLATVTKQEALLTEAVKMQAEQATQTRDLLTAITKLMGQSGEASPQLARLEQLLLQERKERAAERAAQVAESAAQAERERRLLQSLAQLSERIGTLEKERDGLRERLGNLPQEEPPRPATTIAAPPASVAPTPPIEQPVATESQTQSVGTQAVVANTQPIEPARLAPSAPPAQATPTVTRAAAPTNHKPSGPSKPSPPTGPPSRTPPNSPRSAQTAKQTPPSPGKPTDLTILRARVSLRKET